MVTMVQFSDLHITSSPNVSIDTSISSIVSDLGRHKNEVSPIPKPDLVVLCGDIIQGPDNLVDLKSALAEIEHQYNTANEFLNRLCAELFNGDKNRIIIVPGNHDVSWPHSYMSMKKIERLDEELTKACKNPRSNIRWCWKDHSYYRIDDTNIYNKRFESFHKFYRKFYDNQRTFSLQPENQFNIFEFHNDNLLFAGFNSCYYNDHLNNIGRVNPDCIANCYDIINQEKYEDWFKIAVWHHGVYGFPTSSDYLDEETIQFLIDKGFHLGLHGHKHKADLLNIRFAVDCSADIKIIGCGTLGSTQENIPRGETRQYNMIEIKNHYNLLKLHIRKSIEESLGLPLWMPGNIRQNNDKSYMDMDLRPLSTFTRHAGGDKAMQVKQNVFKELAEAEESISNKEYKLALTKLESTDKENPLVRRLVIECLAQLELDEECINLINEPKTIIEFTYLAEALWRQKKFPELKELIDVFSKKPEIADSAPFRRMSDKIIDRGI